MILPNGNSLEDAQTTPARPHENNPRTPNPNRRGWAPREPAPPPPPTPVHPSPPSRAAAAGPRRRPPHQRRDEVAAIEQSYALAHE